MGRPGLLGLAARTAVVAGTATAVTGAMGSHREKKAEQHEYAAAAQQAELQRTVETAVSQADSAAFIPAPATSASAGETDLIGELQKLADLKSTGALSDEEFTAAKSKLLN